MCDAGTGQILTPIIEFCTATQEMFDGKMGPGSWPIKIRIVNPMRSSILGHNRLLKPLKKLHFEILKASYKAVVEAPEAY